MKNENQSGHTDDYWYDHRDQLEPGQIFVTRDSSLVKLDRRVPGDGTKWYVADWNNGWSYCDSTIEPGDLIGLPSKDPSDQAKARGQSCPA